jgi:DNA-binding PadR family transcriptional regulator
MSTPNLDLTPTSYAILGMVGQLRSCTTYELGKGMQASFDYFWPRARSLVYAEVKRLAASGLLDARKDFVGKRPRTTYTLTPAGRETLAAWLHTPPRAFALELEGLLRLYLAPFGTRDDLIHALATVRSEAETMLSLGTRMVGGYLDGTSPVMEQIHLRALLNDFLVNYAAFVLEWSERSLATVREWEDLGPQGKRAAALEMLRHLPSAEEPG